MEKSRELENNLSSSPYVFTQVAISYCGHGVYVEVDYNRGVCIGSEGGRCEL